MSTRVLVVDDEQSLARVVASYLERDGHEVSCAFDGPAAVEAARTQRPDVVVLDLGLPGMDGIEVSAATYVHRLLRRHTHRPRTRSTSSSDWGWARTTI